MDLPSLVLGFNPLLYMCFSPKQILNPSTWIDPDKGQPLFINVPCGHCSECIISYRNEWRNRAYYETLDTFLSGVGSECGYLLFDTLTYRNGCLPHLSDFIDVPSKLDFPCFSHYDIQGFYVRLRRKLNYLGYDVADKLKSFTACEYGDDIRFTRRPHYHILLFVKCAIPFKVLSKAISDSWPYGRTDGIAYRGASYVGQHCLFTSMSDSEKFSVNYVTKYCTKQFAYNSLVQKRLDSLLYYDFNCYLLAKDFVTMGHWQSKGFGHDAMIRLIGKDNLLETGSFKIIAKNGITISVNLHKSLQRKLLYDYSRDSNGCVHFKLNSDGFAYKKKFWFRSLKYLIDRIAPFKDYNIVKQEVVNNFFVDNRFKKYETVDELVDNSYNVESGLRNYSCVDYSFIHRSVFTKKDYGSKKVGFRHSLLRKSKFGSLDDDSYIVLDDLKKLVLNSVNPNMDNYYHSKLVNGDGQLEVLKLKHRLEHIHKNSFCYV